jgi:pimeloyl-ACP methyl ester carboxylesterase
VVSVARAGVAVLYAGDARRPEAALPADAVFLGRRSLLVLRERIENLRGRLREPGHAVAGSRWYRTFLIREFLRWLRGEFDHTRVTVPIRWLHGTADPVLTPTLLRRHENRADGFQVELVDGVGHWIAEQQPVLVLDRLRARLADIHKPRDGTWHFPRGLFPLPVAAEPNNSRHLTHSRPKSAYPEVGTQDGDSQ